MPPLVFGSEEETLTKCPDCRGAKWKIMPRSHTPTLAADKTHTFESGVPCKTCNAVGSVVSSVYRKWLVAHKPNGPIPPLLR